MQKTIQTVDAAFHVRAYSLVHGRCYLFSRSFTSLYRAEKFAWWMRANTDHVQVRVERDSGQVVVYA